ncbi:MAG TPA: hypothetical protein VHE35_00075 [Kofleriaceae bacterium]|nr:hypothetical protein [Kofleriaceae bacterium]
MSRSKIAAIVLAAAVAIAGLAFSMGHPGSSSHPTGTAAPKAPAAGTAERPLLPVTRPTLPPAPSPPPVRVPPPPVTAKGVAIGRGQTIATINGVAITGADLVAFRAKDGDSLHMSPEMYDFLAQRAIEREVTLQAARARNLELSAADEAQVAQARANAAARGETDPARLAFEEKEARAQLLLEALARAEGAPPAMPDDAAVDAYLKDHASELGPLPSDPQAVQQLRISIRQKLYEEMANAHEESVRALLARLEAEAHISF